ncbi:MAG: hypothetical protein WCT19_03625 [Candidatus Paceibacterota bacterium]|jgi:hypothetical protein
MNFLNTSFIFQKIYDLFHDQSPIQILQTLIRYFYAFLDWFWPFAIILSLIFLVGIMYCVIRITQIRTEERIEFAKAATKIEMPAYGSNPKWDRVLSLVESDNHSDWRLAILEADIMLEEMVKKMGYRGVTLGEILKKIEQSDFTTIGEAWEAHNVRNAIAHEGPEFLLNQREAKRIIQLYEQVFNEFKFI